MLSDRIVRTVSAQHLYMHTKRRRGDDEGGQVAGVSSIGRRFESV